MPTPSRELLKELRRFNIALTVFLVGFVVLLVMVCIYYILPGADALREATPKEKKQLAAYSTLLMAVILFVLGAALVLAFRISRRFGKEEPKSKTEYVDAWAEAGRRLKNDDPE